jgi:hypothetical protein
MNKLLAVTAVAALAFAPGCQSKAEKRLSALRGYRDRMCECTDAICKFQVAKDEIDAELENFKAMSMQDIVDRDEDVEREAKEIEAAERKCQQNSK